MDRWELKIGDSLTEKVENALTKSSAVIVIISKSSVDSGWCRRELNAVLVREIEEKRSLILPCRIDNCDVPLFLKDKFYADFMSDPDKALHDIDTALLTISNPFQSRFEEPEFVTDWAVDWATEDGSEVIRCHFVDHGPNYVVVSTCSIVCNTLAGENFKRYRSVGKDSEYIEYVLGLIEKNLEKSPLNPPIIIKDHFERFVTWNISNDNEKFNIVFTYRRMGTETGFDTLVHLDNNIRRAREHMNEVDFMPRSVEKS